MKKLFTEVPAIAEGRLELKGLTMEYAEDLQRLKTDDEVYRHEPTFLFERKYDGAGQVIENLYGECFKESIILGIFEEGKFCGLAEMYGYRDPIHKISIGYRLLRERWGRGIASETVRMLVNWLYTETDIEIITASTLPENKASAAVLKKNGFTLVVKNSPEDWGYEEPLPTDKWIR